MKPALSAQRSLSVLTYMTVRPGSVFSLTELSSALDVSPASMSAVLLAMCDAGYLERHPRHRTYSLGPAAVALGHAASDRHPVIEASRAELRRLATLGSECLGSAVVGDDIMILAMEGRPNGRSRGSWVGQRIPLVPPFGQVFLAWHPGPPVDAWLGRLGNLRSEHEVALRSSLDLTRRRGFFIGLRNVPVQTVVDTVHASSTVPDADAHRRLEQLIPDQIDGYGLDVVDPDRHYDVANLAVPVFDGDAAAVYALTLYGLDDIPGRQLTEVAGRMLDSAAVITREIGGRPPLPTAGGDRA
ncbi:IclR family transcriptional regulator [Nakamurella alba]|uniref:IclR family transcriptional regulator n=1 Tax=Nakamurella alba TaxID=2665158 RepID=UPI0018AA5CC5|nr:hypothetical protein [Nakamurella alba]